MTAPNETMALVLYEPPREFFPTRPQESAPTRRGFFTHLITFVCALSCMLSVTVLFLTSMEWVSRFSLQEQMLTMANRALLGQALFSRMESEILSDGDFPFPPAAIPDSPPPEESPAESDPPKEDIRYPIDIADLSAGGDILATFNETSYEPNGEFLLASPLPFEDFPAWQSVYGGTGEPYILILHTHGTEAYSAEGQSSYTPSDSFRSVDTSENVVAVGRVMADTFAAAGIPTLHCTDMFDRDSYRDAYTYSARAVREYLAAHPSIRIVLDVHRDSIVRSDNTKIRPVTEVDGMDIAQFMIVTGTDFKGANHPDWQNNLNFALKIQKNMTDYSSTLCRAINLRGAGFNQQYAPGSLLLEVGSCGNTLLQAKRTAVLVAAAITETVTGKPCPIRVGDILV